PSSPLLLIAATTRVADETAAGRRSRRLCISCPLQPQLPRSHIPLGHPIPPRRIARRRLLAALRTVVILVPTRPPPSGHIPPTAPAAHDHSARLRHLEYQLDRDRSV